MTQQQWQPISTAPENTPLLLWGEYVEDHYVVDRFTWLIEHYDELVSHTATRKVYETREKRERQWSGEGWSATHWMPLPDPPATDQEGR